MSARSSLISASEKRKSQHRESGLWVIQDAGGKSDGSQPTPSAEPLMRSADLEKNAANPESTEVEETFKVTWDGSDDPRNPYNWPSSKKWSMVAVISAITLATPLASSMFAPGVPDVMTEFHSDSLTLASFVVSVFLLGYAAGPLLMAPLAEYFGRTWVYHISMTLFIAFTVACAVADSLNSLIAFRFFAGTAGSAPLVLGGGTIADCYPPERRGVVMTLWTIGPLLGPVIGPIAGGFISTTIGWRWVFWVIAVFTAVCLIFQMAILRETYAPVLLERKAAAIRKRTGDDRYVSAMNTGTPKELFKKSIVRPLKMLLLSPIVLFMSLYMSIIYGYLYILFTTLTPTFEDEYGFATGVVGLTFLGLGVGMFIGMIIFGMTSDKAIQRQKARGKVIKPEMRLPLVLPGSLCIPIGLFWYGWSAQAKIHWIMPVIGTTWVGMGLIGVFMPIQTYLIDAFTLYAASVTAAVTILRSLVGAILPLAGRPLYQSLGLGWGNSVLGFIALASCAVPILFTKYGERIRTSERFQRSF